MKRFSLVVLFVLLFIPVLSTGGDFYEEQLDKGIRNSEAYSYFLIEESKADSSKAEKTLEEALRCSPDLPAVYFALLKTSLSFSTERMYKAYGYLLKGIEAYERNFWWSFTVVGSLFLSLIISFILSIIIIIMIRLPGDLPRLSHDIMEQNSRILLLLILISALIGPLLLIGGILIILGLYLKKVDRVVVYLYLVFLLISPWVFKASSMVFSIPSSDVVKAVIEVNESRDNRYAISILGNSEDTVALYSYALALKREGYYDEAIQMYNKLIARKPDPVFYNNLANCYVAKNDMERAKQLYEKSIQMRPLVSASYNMSQVLRRTLDLIKGEEYFLYAQKIDPDSVSRFQEIFSQNPNRLVIDEVLPISALWQYSKENATRVSTFGLSTVPPALLSFIALFFGALFYVLNKRIKPRAHRCKKCGAILCKRCERRVLWGNMCLQCFRSLIKLHELDARERIARLQTVYEYQMRRRRNMNVLSFLLPGSAQIYAGDVLKGLLFLWSFLFFLCVFVISSVFVIGMPYFPHLWLNWSAFLLMAIVYFVSNTITRLRLVKRWL
ncbi:MAG TPA: tetratricopeptide repeat protein [Thermodesulfovibrionales bacterium]|nr:tetratricopeptide repeat protein [Thermodesulfovibrionales bacterium]